MHSLFHTLPPAWKKTIQKEAPEVTSVNGDYVILLHGIARTSRHMAKLEHLLASSGYRPINLDYLSTRHPLEELIEHVHEQIEKATPDKTRTIHMLGYSMGGLVVRGIINRHRPAHLGRVILLPPPNHGSEVADFLKDNPIYRHIYGPAGQQLATSQKNVQKILGKIDAELGIIAGDRSIDPFSSLLLKGVNDGKVSVESTKMEGMKDHIVLHANHTFFPNTKAVMEQVIYFLEHGQFRRKT
jgi:pimeloyl-ACP methyl ester carboxylesterase